MVRQNLVLPNLARKWYGSSRAVRTDGAAHGTLILLVLACVATDVVRVSGVDVSQ